MSTAFSHAPSKVLAAAIVARGFGTDPAPWLQWAPDSGVAPPNSPWPVFHANEGAFPDNCITTYMAEPQVDAKLQLTGEIITHWGITVRVRGTDHDTAWAKGEALRIDFNQVLSQQDVTIGTAKYLVYNVPKCVPARPMLLAPGSTRWFANLNCLAVIIPYPLIP